MRSAPRQALGVAGGPARWKVVVAEEDFWVFWALVLAHSVVEEVREEGSLPGFLHVQNRDTGEPKLSGVS